MISPPAGSPAAAHVDGPVLAALALLWGEALWRWQAVWRHLPDSAYGWAVPALIGFLLWERWSDRPAVLAPSVRRAGLWWSGLIAGVAAAGLLRLLLEPFPLWPAALWLFTGVVLGLTFALLTLAFGGLTARHFAFPLAFILTALPWPALVDTFLVFPLRSTLAAIAAQGLNAAGHPAIVHGTIVQVGAGLVGVDEACSGIRSLQAASMVALFLGELYRFSGLRRLALFSVGLALALGSNLLRTLFLAWQCALHGPVAVGQWHDPAGYALLFVCLGGLVAVALHWRSHALRLTPQTPTPRRTVVAKLPRQLALALMAGVVVIEAGTQLWYAHGDRQARRVDRWTAQLPASRPDYREDPFTANMQALLGCDAHQLGHWTVSGGQVHAGFVLDWRRGQTARFATALHNPSICLPMGGNPLRADRGQILIEIGRLKLPFHAYVFASEATSLHVYYLPWDVQGARPFPPRTATRGPSEWIAQQWAEVREARRDFAATVFTLAIFNAPSDADADQAFRDEVSGLIAIENP